MGFFPPHSQRVREALVCDKTKTASLENLC